MKRLTKLGLVGIALAVLSLAVAPRGASAHPMGNFSINQYSALTVGSGKVELRYIVDMAEIPTFQELSKIRDDHSTDLTPEQRTAFIDSKTAELSKGLALMVNGNKAPLTLDKSALSFPLGSGGLPTLRLELHYSASLSGVSKGKIEYRDTNFLDRVGWKEIIAVPGTGTTFEQSNVPETDLTNGLTQYSPTATSSPLSRAEATILFAPGIAPVTTGGSGVAQMQPAGQGAVDWAKQRIDDVASLISQDNLPLGAMMLGLLIAFFWGAGHALSPGHGKTIVAAYLVGTRGTAKHAAMLGLTVTISHTIGVFALGLVVLFAANFIVPDQLYPIIGFISGGSIVLLGIVMFVQRWRSWQVGKAHHVETSHSHGGPDHVHEHGMEHSHEHEQDHVHDHPSHHEHDHTDIAVAHSHGPFGKPHTHVHDGQKISTRGLLAMGITGGIIPCPTALVVLLAAIAYHRVALGLAWIVSFSLGLAAVLTVLGLLVVYGRSFVGRFRSGGMAGGLFGRLTGTLMPRLPMASALVVAVLGFLIAYQAILPR